MNNAIFKFRFDKKKGIVPATDADIITIEMFKARCEPNQIIECYMEIEDEHSTRIQQNKLYKLLRELSMHTGFTLSEMKAIIKKEAGLVVHHKSGIQFKSFSECTKSELSYAIQTCINVGMTADCHIY